MPRTISLTPFSDSDSVAVEGLLRDGWVANNVPSLAGLIEELRQLQAAHPDHRILATLEDYGQAQYTSGHTINANNLDRVARTEAPDAPHEWFEGEPDGFADGPQAFPYILSNLLKKAVEVHLASLEGLLPWSDPDVPGNDPLSLNLSPDSFLQLSREREIFIQAVPVARAADALAAFSNGYFNVDLNPMQNHTLARALEEGHGLGLFGIGASTLAFWRDTPLDAAGAGDVAKIITCIYYEVPAEQEKLLARALTGKREVLLRYTES